MAESRTRPLLELLVKVSREIATALDLRTVLQRLLFAAIQYVGGERGSIVVMDDSGKPVDATIVYGRQFHDHTTQQLRETVEKGLAGWVVQNRKSALVPDTSKDERWLRRADDAVEKSGAKSAICVPLMTRDRMVGVLTLVHPIPNTFNEEHLELMQAIADQASVAVLNARLYTETQRTARVMSALAEGAAAINTSLAKQDVLRRILNQTMQALQVETVALALIDPASTRLVFQAAAGNNSGEIPGIQIPDGKGLAGTVIQDGAGMIVPSVRQDPRYSDLDRLNGVEMRALAIAPIQSHGKVIGVLEAINPTSGSFDPDAMVVMTGLGSLAGTTIQNAELFEQLQKAHTHYRELFDDSIDTIMITDWNGRVLEANRQAVYLSGYSIEQLHSLTIEQLHEVNWTKSGSKFDLLRLNGGCNYESSLFRQDGGTTPVEVYARRVEYDDTESIQWILRDITARKELDALRDDMTSMIFHDLRSPLGNIVSSLEMMSTLLPDDDTLVSMLTIARNSTGRIQRLVNSLLDINRLESGQPVVDQNSIDPVALIRESLRDVEPSSAARQQTLFNRATSVIPMIWVDVDMVYRVFVNLLENAIKFTPVGGRIEIGAQTAPDGMFVKFWVRDSGLGIPPTDQERIFEKFTRLRGRNRPGGLGVGLAFCRLAVLGHGGEIWVESELEKGTTFWLTLPVAKRQSTTGQLKRQTGRLTFKPDHR
ncbi:MAG TPA: GAF domain-containing protein [Anaerolineales bacterium]|nr:GAF domain-containing protein [Anaerolineales bacterium]HNN13017.1 GAF domain-containing protein [Anaerolineales bacterium]HNO30295.1 GAF domain-containing protein [Anaerolineales bacterium]